MWIIELIAALDFIERWRIWGPILVLFIAAYALSTLVGSDIDREFLLAIASAAGLCFGLLWDHAQERGELTPKNTAVKRKANKENRKN